MSTSDLVTHPGAATECEVRPSRMYFVRFRLEDTFHGAFVWFCHFCHSSGADLEKHSKGALVRDTHEGVLFAATDLQVHLRLSPNNAVEVHTPEVALVEILCVCAAQVVQRLDALLQVSLKLAPRHVQDLVRNVLLHHLHHVLHLLPETHAQIPKHVSPWRAVTVSDCATYAACELRCLRVPHVLNRVFKTWRHV